MTYTTATTITSAAVAAASDPVQDLFGAPATSFEFNTSSLAGLTALSNTPDFEDAHTTVPDYYFVRDNAAGSLLCGRYASTPATPFTAITKGTTTSVGSSAMSGLFVGQATPGVVESIGLNPSSGVFSVSMVRWTNPTTFSALPGTSLSDSGVIYYAITVNSTTNLDFRFSYDALNWKSLVLARDPSITVGSVGLFHVAAGVDSATIFDYLRIWTSALTFPGA